MKWTPGIQPLASLVEYHNYWIDDGQGGRTQNPAFDGNCRMLLDLKSETDRNHARAVAHFSQEVATFLRKCGLPPSDRNVYIVIVPSSKQGQWGAGLERIATNLVRRNANFVAATRALERHTTIQKLARGGNRNPAVHTRSIQLGKNWRTLARKTVLLLDDITTTGNSLNACAQLLTQIDVELVFTLAIGRTV
jgi:predicted amidophosphoribosyltransferase